jgi:GGDEF domain-containing protein
MIHRWIHEALTWAEYSIIYIDLDQFKGYNDTYGFLMGDEFLNFTAELISPWLNRLPEGARLGHVGGDDFVVINRGIVREDSLAELCGRFDQQKLDLFKNVDIERGYIEAADRQGNKVKMPLITLSAAVIDSSKVWQDPHPALFSEVAASLKSKVKKMTADTGKSGFLYQQRLHV